MGVELTQRRAAFGLAPTAPALVIADDASQHSDSNFSELRKQWEAENYCQLLGCDEGHAVQVPGGFGAAGAPYDPWHQSWRLLRRAWLRKAVANSSNPAFGRNMSELQFDLRGEAHTTCPLMTSLHADVYALEAFRQHRCGTGRPEVPGRSVAAGGSPSPCQRFHDGIDQSRSTAEP